MGDLSGRCAVITGGASGIGRGMAEAFLDRGARVALLDINPDVLAQARDELDQRRERVLTLEVDAADPTAVHEARDVCLESLGHVDIVCANAGHGSRELPVWEIPIEEWRWVFDINTFGIIHMAHAFVPAMIEADFGHFVVTSSMQGITTGRVGPYAASKHAAASVAESIFADLQRLDSRVGVSCLCPSYTKNSMIDHPERMRRFVAEELDDEQRQAQAKVAQKLSEFGIEARAVGDMVVDAIAEQTFWITPTPGSLERVTRRAHEIVGHHAPSIADT